MKALVGYTGFVGSNLYEQGTWDCAYNSKNIQEAYGTQPDLLVYAGVRAEKYLANQAPEQDLAQIMEAQENIRKIAPRKLVLISTIDVFRIPKNVDETTAIETNGLHPYGANRYRLEQWVRAAYPDALIIRLPGLFGKNIKKNFIFDYLNVIPAMLKESKFRELSAMAPELTQFYFRLDNGFFRAEIPQGKHETVKNIFRRLGFSALNFTDSRSRYQFYGLSNLWKDMNTVLDAGLTLWHPAAEPVAASELYKYLSGDEFVNELPGTPADYDYRTIHAALFGGANGYIASKDQVMKGIKEFVTQFEASGRNL
ncbi:MAG: sugar nucleotide-binding protein [Anaerolineaceae bacterium]|nr:sugar nucleotide-binding protein [Anaerolineaceae bacterium]